MAESRPVPARPTPPRRPGAPGSRPAPRPTLRAGAAPTSFDEPDDATVAEGPRVVPAPVETAREPLPASPVPRTPERSRAEKVLVLVLLLGIGLNLGAFLLEDGNLTRLDLLFASVIVLAGLALLGVAEICRRTGRSSQ